MKFIRIKEVLNSTGLSRSVLYAMMSSGSFPQSFPLSGRTVAWLESEVQGFIEARIQERNQCLKNKSGSDV